MLSPPSSADRSVICKCCTGPLPGIGGPLVPLSVSEDVGEAVEGAEREEICGAPSEKAGFCRPKNRDSL